MAVDALLAALEQDAEAEMERLRSEARERAAATVARAAAEVDRRRTVALERLTDERRAVIGRETAAAERALRRRLLLARAGVIDRVFARAREELSGMAVGRYEGDLPALVNGALVYLEQRASELVCPEDAREAVVRAARLNGAARVSAEPGALPGVLARTAERDVVVDNTLVARLDRMRGDLAIELSGRLEGRPDAVG